MMQAVGRVRVKVCGITRLEDAEAAVDHGADAVGFICWSGSPRFVAPDVVRVISRALPPFVSRVGVFVNAGADEIARVIEHAALDVVQLHGDEDVQEYDSIGAKLIKALPLSHDADVSMAEGLPPGVLALIDAVDRERRGGTGLLANWPRAAAVARRRPIVLAGGLDANNIGKAIREVRPWAVDVSSGVETSPGQKSRALIEAFFEELRAARLEDK
jgi:phosphoribosylanthranilate isomerase